MAAGWGKSTHVSEKASVADRPSEGAASASSLKLKGDQSVGPIASASSAVLIKKCKDDAGDAGRQAKGFFVDVGYPVLNKVVDSFLRVAGVGALQAMSKQAIQFSFRGHDSNVDDSFSSQPKFKSTRLHVETNKQALEKLMERTAKESLQWGLAAGIFTGVSYGLQEAQGKHTMCHAALAGALTGASFNIATQEKPCLEQTLQSAITGSAIAVAGEIIHNYL